MCSSDLVLYELLPLHFFLEDLYYGLESDYYSDAGVAFWDFSDLAFIVMIGIVVIVLYNTTLTQWLWIGGLAAVPDITRGSYLFFLKPVVAAFLSVTFLGISLSIWQMFAILIICSAVVTEALISYYQQKK